jgi:prophage DNA circulation protein
MTDMTDYQTARDTLATALEADGSGLLIHPTMGQATVYVEHYNVVENKMKGGFCEFEMEFIEAGSQSQPSPNPVVNVATAAQNAITSLTQSSTMQAASIAPTTPSVGTNGFGLSGSQAPTSSSPYGSLS